MPSNAATLADNHALLERAKQLDARSPRLDKLQLGHLRHIENLAARPDGDWSLMGTADPGQEWLDAYRYQLAKMVYALGLAHYHRLPAAPCVFQPLMHALIRKMLRRDVWGYWKETSQSGPFLDPGLTKLRTPWTDPVVKENIMYSGHLHAMTGMYAVLFDDDRYAQPGALTLVHQPIFYGLGPQKFEYDFRKINDTIYWQMVENGWLGVACEPNCVFLICNQFPMLGFRFHDLRHGTQLAEDATASYRAAWQQKGMLDEYGHFQYFWRQKQDVFFSPGRAMSDTWLGAVMNAWNSEMIQSLAPTQALDWFTHHADGTVSLRPPTVVKARREALAAGTPLPADEDTAYNFGAPEFGYAAIWASELGDQPLLEGLLAHADLYMNPTWAEGGLYYPRYDPSWDAEGHMRYMDPLTGNALIAYARLNVANGLRTLYEKPWDTRHFEQPAVRAISPGFDLTRACFDADARALALTIAPRKPGLQSVALTIDRAEAHRACLVLRDGEPVDPGSVAMAFDNGRMTLALEIGHSTDLVLAWEKK